MKKSKQKEKIQSELDSNFSDLDWSPASVSLVKIGGKLKTHKLIRTDEGILVFKQTLIMWISNWMFLLAGMGIIYLPRAIVYETTRDANIIISFFTLFGSVVMLCGIYMLGFRGHSLVFDGHNKEYRKGDTLWSFFFKGGKRTHIDFDDIIAIQFIGRYEVSSDSDFDYLYQINLVLDDKSRINVVDHADGTAARKDAIYLAEFLGVPFLEEASR